MSGPETPLAGRYRFVRRIQAGQKTIAWLVSDQRSDRQLVAAALGASRLKALKPALGVRHKYLASIVEVVEDPNPAEIPGDGAVVRAAAVALAEIVSGLTLHDQLKGGSLGVSDSVAVLAGVCDATEALHGANAAHGAISPRSILIAPSTPRPTPVLLQLVAPTSGAYSTPERLLGQGPTVEDDVWALHASLYASLTGSAPFEGTSKDALVSAMQSDQRKPLSDFGVDEPSLQTLINRGFDGDSSKRTRSVRELKQGLYDWLRARVPQRDSLSELAPPSLDWNDPAPVMESAPPIALYSDEDDSEPQKPKSAEEEKSPEVDADGAPSALAAEPAERAAPDQAPAETVEKPSASEPLERVGGGTATGPRRLRRASQTGTEAPGGTARPEVTRPQRASCPFRRIHPRRTRPRRTHLRRRVLRRPQAEARRARRGRADRAERTGQ